MIGTSEAYKELILNNYRPRVEVTITANPPNGGEAKVWGNNNLKSFNFKWSADPAGRELPSLELRLTEYISPDIDYLAEIKRLEYSRINVKIFQNLEFAPTWKAIYQKARTWKGFFDGNDTWKRLFTEIEKEVFNLPTMFLTPNPIREKNEITWVAKDLFYFLNLHHKMEFGETSYGFLQPIIQALEAEKVGKPQTIATDLEMLIADLNAINSTMITTPIIIEDNTKNIILNYSKTRNKYFNFNVKKTTLKDLADGLYVILFDQEIFPKGIIYSYPKETYSPLPLTYECQKYQRDGNDMKKAEIFSIEMINGSNQKGDEPLVEDNKYFIFSQDKAEERGAALNLYFQGGSDIDFQSLPILHFEVGDGCVLPPMPNMGEEIEKRGIFTKIEMEYTGVLKQKWHFHEIVWE